MKYAPLALIFFVLSANATPVEEPNTIVYPRCMKIDPETHKQLPGYNIVMDIGNKFKIVSPNGNSVISISLAQSEKIGTCSTPQSAMFTSLVTMFNLMGTFYTQPGVKRRKLQCCVMVKAVSGITLTLFISRTDYTSKQINQLIMAVTI